MEGFDELMQRLVEIDRDGRQRSAELIAEDKRFMDGLLQRNAPENPIKASLAKPAQAIRGRRWMVALIRRFRRFDGIPSESFVE